MKLPEAERHQLSKSTFMYGCQCPKRLWLHKNLPDLRDELEESQTAIFQTGTNVGLLARKLFSGGVDASPPEPYFYQQSVADTYQYIKQGVTVIYEAAFQYQGVLAAIDIIVKDGDQWIAYEVKGTNSVKEPHILDAALQYYVITQAGIPLSDFRILHLNAEYVRYGELDLKALFKPTSVLKEIITRQNFIQ
jgi:Holliday junction resolvase-like predicted endonuclease